MLSAAFRHGSLSTATTQEGDMNTSLYCATQARRLIGLREHWVRLARTRDGLESCYISFARNANRCAVNALKEARKYAQT